MVVEQPRNQLGMRNRADSQRLTSGTNGGEQGRRVVGNQDVHVAIGRLLERLQQGVLDRLAGAVDTVDQEYAQFTGDRGSRALAEPAACRGDDALSAGAAIAPAFRRPDHQVRMRAGTGRAAGSARVAGPPPGVRIGTKGERQQVVHEGILARPSRTVDQQRPLQPAGAGRTQGNRPGGGLPDAEEAARGCRVDHRGEYRIGSIKGALTGARPARRMLPTRAPPRRPGHPRGGRPATGPALRKRGRRAERQPPPYTQTIRPERETQGGCHE